MDINTLSGKVLTIYVKEVGVPKTYEYNGNTRECVNVLLVDASGYMPAIIHNPTVMQMFRQGKYYRIYGTLTYDTNKKMLIINTNSSVSVTILFLIY